MESKAHPPATTADRSLIVRPPATPDQLFGQRVGRIAKQQCERLLDTQHGQQAAQRITMAILASMQAARDPSAFHQCTDLSLAAAIALSAQTGLLPGGPFTPVYLVPQAPRTGEPPALQWRINHRGICILAYRAGFVIRSVPVANDDFLRVSLGEVVEHKGATDIWPDSLDALQGIAVVVRDIARGQDVIRAFVPRVVIEARRAKARDPAVWNAWPVEMSQGAAIRYLMARGSIPIDSPELTIALDAEAVEHVPDRDVVERPAEAIPTSTPRAALGLDVTPPSEPQREVEPVAVVREPVLRNPEPSASVEKPLAVSVIKNKCADLEREILGATVQRIRRERGIPDGDIGSWRGRPESAQAYLVALQAARHAELEAMAEAAAQTPTAPREPGQDEDEDAPTPDMP